MTSETLEWVTVIGSMLLSWPTVGLFALIMFHKPLLEIFQRFASTDLRKAKVGPFEIERELTKLSVQGQEAITNLNRINELMAESRLLELEITDEMFRYMISDEQQEKMRNQIEEFRKLTQKVQPKK